MAEPIVAQKINFDTISRIKSNFSKDPKDRHSLQYFEVRLERLQECWGKAKELHPSVYQMKLQDAALLKDYIASYETAEETSLYLMTKFKEAIREFEKASRSQETNQQAQSSETSMNDAIRLERIKIPKFEGDYLKWATFHELFQTLVHENSQLKDIQKLQYLLTSVGGEARGLIENLSMTEANYNKAWQLLQERYSNKRVILSAYLQTFINLPAIKSESAIGYKRILDTTNEMMAGIDGIGIATSTWYPIIIHIASHKLDMEARKDWELSCGIQTKIPAWTDFANFLERKFRSLEVIGKEDSPKRQGTKVHVTTQNTSKCPVCKDNHPIYKCGKFQGMSVEKRKEFVKAHNLCFNCLKSHRLYECKSTSTCKTCNKRHNSMLHLDTGNRTKDHEVIDASATNGAKVQSNHANQQNFWNILLATAIISVKNASGKYVKLRALLDQGSQNSFVTEEAAKLLGIQRNNVNIIISGIGSSTKKCHGQIPLTIKEKWSNKTISTNALILGRITSNLPSTTINKITLNCDTDELADPNFHISAKIDILLGADVYGDIIEKGIRRGRPTAQKTKLGWILTGPTVHITPSFQAITMVSTAELDQTLRKFWEQEETEQKRFPTEEEEEIETRYRRTTQRLENGRFQVELPFKQDPRTQLAVSHKNAIERYCATEKRLMANPKLMEEYNKCLQDYLDSNHMEEVPKNERNNPSYYLPHHAVTKETSTTTKVRVVFNASAKTASGKSLNDILLVGPTIQDTLVTLLLRWRLYPVVLTADIEKMYRQVQVKAKHVDFQRILWRPQPEDIIRHYRLKTVTFGTASAPFQAIRTLKQLANNERERFPRAVKYLLNDFYVDDLMTGVDTPDEAIALYHELTQLLSMGGFNLRKWNSNCNDVMREIPVDARGTDYPLSLKEEDTIKTLGLQWHPQKDTFIFNTRARGFQHGEEITKRTVASFMATMFDPLGWLQPIIIKGKIFMQKLWLHKLNWDELLPQELVNEWQNYLSEIPAIENIKVHRWIGTTSSDQCELHGFCDASRQAIAAVIYIRIEKVGQTTPIVKLLTAKTKVTPLAVQTIPRLELSSASLLVKLMEQTRLSLRNSAEIPVHYWTDSSVVLSWLSDHPARWNTYVANRVSEIHSASTIAQWHHISSRDNPADCASRGLSSTQLRDFNLWWNGPSILHSPKITFPRSPNSHSIQLERRKVALTATSEGNVNIIHRFSSYSKLLRVVAYCRRWLLHHRLQQAKCEQFLTAQELQEAKIACAKISQQEIFEAEIKKLAKGKQIDANSRILQLNPYLDTYGVLRVGGRLQHAAISATEKHPIILSHQSKFSEMIINYFHQKTLHGSAQLTLDAVRKEFWIVGAPKMVKTCIHKCIKCFRTNAQPKHQLMGNLPINRVAMHLELVSDLTTSACIAAIKRFISRRGKCKNIYSDCGTNFISAGKELRTIYATIESETRAYLANEGIVWHHIPPSSPHFGGLWEAGVKSVKRHLVKAFGESLLNVEEMYTALAQIEACLNSRPLAPLSTDVNDNEALTPAHFLTGDSMFAIPESVPDNVSFLRRWQLTQKLSLQFWDRWHREYLTRLQERPKWLKPQKNFEPGQLVLVKTENTPPTKWPLARIIEIHPGEDGLVRVVTVKLRGYVTKRPIAKLCLLPIDTATSDFAQSPAEQQENVTESAERTGVSRKRHLTTSNLGIASWPAMMLGLLTICMISLPATETSANVTRLSSGLYIEHIGKAFMNKGILQLNLRVPYSDVNEDRERTIKVIQNMQELCSTGEKINEEIQCQVLNRHLQLMADDIHREIKTIQFFRTRLRRGLLGSLLTKIFGVNDEVYHEIDNLSDNQINIRRAVDKQGKLMLKATKTLDSTNHRIADQLSRFHSQMNETIRKINDFNNQIHVDHNKIHVHFLSAYQNARNYLDEVHGKYNCLRKIMLDQTNIWGCAQIIDVVDVVNKTESSLPATLKVFHKSTAAAQTERSEDATVVRGHFPIYDITQYELIKASPVPQRISNRSFAISKLQEGIIAINYDSQKYFSLTEDDFKASLIIRDETYMVQLRALYDIQAHPNCVITEVYDSHGGTRCPTQQFSTQSIIWKKMYQRNCWLYITPSITVAHAVCSGIRSEIRLEDAGIIRLTPDCSLSTSEVLLLTENPKISSTLEIYFKPITTIFSMSSSDVIPVLNGSLLLQPSDSFSNLIQEAYDNQREFADATWKPLRRHIISTSISIIVTICLMISLGIYYCKTKKPTNHTREEARWYSSEDPL